eukprot:TRINITY_DN1145_c0_g1_i1.p1 TRINITY_DN1145_c0_g1~~TRINITY_DN1145_c0_g1_i1.p1  ORF type:complete len:513 (-),score=98.27 TRINITY_DN1145_c0_g1_i1:349-1887(-)
MGAGGSLQRMIADVEHELPRSPSPRSSAPRSAWRVRDMAGPSRNCTGLSELTILAQARKRNREHVQSPRPPAGPGRRMVCAHSMEACFEDTCLLEQVLRQAGARALWRAMAVSQDWRHTSRMVWRDLYRDEAVPTSLADFWRTHQVLCHRFVLDIRYRHIQRRPQLTSNHPECVAWDVEMKRWVLVRKVPRVLSETSQALGLLADVRLLRHFAYTDIIPDLYQVQLVSGEMGLGGEVADAYVITEAPDTSLYNLLHPNRERLAPEHVQWFLHRLLSGLSELHSAEIYHLDLSPFNIQLFSNCDLRIVNVAWECQVPGLQTTEPKKFQRWYKAPETFLNDVAWHNTEEGKAAADLWAVGCIFAEMITGQVLFPGHDYYDQIRLIVERLGFPEDKQGQELILSVGPVSPQPGGVRALFRGWATDEALDLMEILLSFDPLARGSAAEALQHPYFIELIESPLTPSTSREMMLDVPRFDARFAVEALTRTPHSVQEGILSSLVEAGAKLDSSFWIT